MKRKKILITNDDGIQAKGIITLMNIAKAYGDVLVVAPDRSRSGMSSAITVEEPIRLKLHHAETGFESYSCTGTPVDCVKLAFDKLMDDDPDLIISGINHGSNSSVSVHYSGTMGAVIEGCIHEVASVGFSLCDWHPDADFSHFEPFIRRIIEQVLRNGLPQGTCLNVNAPKGALQGIEICRQGNGRWVEEFDKRTDPHKREYYWITGYYQNMDNGSTDTDNHILETSKVSIVPIKVDLTDHQFLTHMKAWAL